VVAERGEIKLEGLGLDAQGIGDVGDLDGGEVRLAVLGTGW
jgi:hypothetical protein